MDQWGDAAMLRLKAAAMQLKPVVEAMASAPPQTSPAASVQRPVQFPRTPVRPPALPPNPDPAAEMQDRFHSHTWPGHEHLNQGITNFGRLSGTLARIQAVSLHNRARSRQFPTVLINRTNQCFAGQTIGEYSNECNTIKINYSDGHMQYEDPAEIETVLAHEWGHHLIRISGVSMSALEVEVVSDCFAGVVFGCYFKHNLIEVSEFAQAARLMTQIANNSEHGYHPNMETRLSSFLGGALIVAEPTHEKAAFYPRYCASLDRVLEIRKVQELGLRWIV